jgi:hypothetical protein
MFPLAPSINSLFVTGLFMFFIFIILIMNYKQIKNLDSYRKLSILSLIAIAIGVHGLLHLGTETVYNFNPYNLF